MHSHSLIPLNSSEGNNTNAWINLQSCKNVMNNHPITVVTYPELCTFCQLLPIQKQTLEQDYQSGDEEMKGRGKYSSFFVCKATYAFVHASFSLFVTLGPKMRVYNFQGNHKINFLQTFIVP